MKTNPVGILVSLLFTPALIVQAQAQEDANTLLSPQQYTEIFVNNTLLLIDENGSKRLIYVSDAGLVKIRDSGRDKTEQFKEAQYIRNKENNYQLCMVTTNKKSDSPNQEDSTSMNDTLWSLLDEQYLEDPRPICSYVYGKTDTGELFLMEGFGVGRTFQIMHIQIA